MKAIPFNKQEQRYLQNQFRRQHRTTADMYPGDVIQFLENRQIENRKDAPEDHSIAEKFLRANRIPVNTTKSRYESRYLDKLERIQVAKSELADAVERYRYAKRWLDKLMA